MLLPFGRQITIVHIYIYIYIYIYICDFLVWLSIHSNNIYNNGDCGW
jgi:hypothetical protein